MIQLIADVQTAAEELCEMSMRGDVLGVVILAHRTDNTFVVKWTSDITDNCLVTMIGELEFVKRDMMKEVYGA
jgi:hypothetical protein